MESLLFEGHEIVGDFFLSWKRGAFVNGGFQSSPIWDYDATVKGGGHNMLVVGYDRTDPSPARRYFILKNSWGGDKYWFVSYDYMRKASRGGVMILDVVDPEVDKPVSLARGGAWIGIWPVQRGAKSELDGDLVVRRTIDPNVPVQPPAGTDITLGEFYPSDGTSAHPLVGHLTSDSVMVLHVGGKAMPEPGRPLPPPGTPRIDTASYTWKFGGSPERSAGK